MYRRESFTLVKVSSILTKAACSIRKSAARQCDARHHVESCLWRVHAPHETTPLTPSLSSKSLRTINATLCFELWYELGRHPQLFTRRINWREFQFFVYFSHNATVGQTDSILGYKELEKVFKLDLQAAEARERRQVEMSIVLAHRLEDRVMEVNLYLNIELSPALFFNLEWWVFNDYQKTD